MFSAFSSTARRLGEAALMGRIRPAGENVGAQLRLRLDPNKSETFVWE
jgi:hypothetical protein